MNRTELIQEAIQAIIETRDLCGNERRALRQFQSDYDITFTKEEIESIRIGVHEAWQAYKVSSGILS